MEDERKGLPYAPYLKFLIERVTWIRFPKDVMHTIYKIEKTQPAAASQAVGGSYAHKDIPESSRSRSCKGNKMKKFGKWLKAIFGKCTYAAERAYETQLEQCEQRGDHLPPLAPPPPPP
jgi:hypothetical protein